MTKTTFLMTKVIPIPKIFAKNMHSDQIEGQFLFFYIKVFSFFSNSFPNRETIQCMEYLSKLLVSSFIKANKLRYVTL